MPPILENPYVVGLAGGLIVACIVWVKSMLKLRDVNKELAKLKQHLQTQMDLDAESKGDRKKELEDLKKANENMRITLANLSHKPGKTEIRQFYVIQKAVDLMFERAPGFAPAWQTTMKEAEATVRDAEEGIVPLIKRVIGSPFQSKALPESTESEESAETTAEAN